MPKVIRTVLTSGNRNESTARYSRENIFLNNNRYSTATFSNNTGSAITLEDGILLKRDTTTAANVQPITTLADIANVIGIARYSGEVSVADAGTTNISYAFKGEIDSNLLVLPTSVTLASVVTAENKTVADILRGIGFVLTPVTELGVNSN